MYKIILINMPFASVNIPSLALTQLKAVLDSRFQDEVQVEIIYLNHDFAHHMGENIFDFIVGSIDSQNAGFGDWVFRQAAFPELADNSEVYFTRYFSRRTKEVNKLKNGLLAMRSGFDAYLDTLITRYSLDKADLVGFTSMFMQNTASFAMARKLKERNPGIITIIGGANCEPPMGQEIAKNVKHIDYVFSGPALKSLPEFVGYRLALEDEKCKEVQGVYCKETAFPRLGHKAIGEEAHIDTPIELNYDSFLTAFYDRFSGSGHKPILSFETSRGCWWGERSHCTFCGLNGLTMAYRAMKPETALEQFKMLFRYSDRVSQFQAVDNILPKNYLQDVLPALSTPPANSLFYEVKADLSEQDIATLSKARVTKIQPGIESLATSTLKIIKKGVNVFQNLSLLKNCVMYGVEPAWNLLVGFPGEGEEVYMKYINDIPWLKHLPPPYGVFPVRFDRYSPYFVKADEYGLNLRPLDYYGLVYPFPEDSLARFAYYFADSNYNATYFAEMSRWFNKLQEQVAPWVESWRNPSVGPPPKLYFKEQGGNSIVYDSRFGKVVERPLNEFSKRILDFTNKPKRLNDISLEFNHLKDSTILNEVAFLQESGWLFQEGERYFNLVLAHEPLA